MSEQQKKELREEIQFISGLTDAWLKMTNNPNYKGPRFNIERADFRLKELAKKL